MRDDERVQREVHGVKQAAEKLLFLSRFSEYNAAGAEAPPIARQPPRSRSVTGAPGQSRPCPQVGFGTGRVSPGLN